MAENLIVQKFPSGEVRVFEGETGEGMVCVEFTRAPGDKRTGNMIGKRQDQMPVPAEPAAE